jgi:hypothetical protein
MSAQDLVLLVADKDTEMSLRGILARREALGIRTVRYSIYVHPEHDPGCRLRAHHFLRHFANGYDHALVVFDREGSGQDTATRDELDSDLEKRLNKSGWGHRAAVVVTDPELEAWVWSDSPHVDQVLGWAGRKPPLRQWLQERGFLQPGQVKPPRPKEAMLAALCDVRKPPSSSLFERLAQTVSFDRCTDDAFAKLSRTLKGWFPT